MSLPLQPFAGIHANPQHLDLGDFVCPPYDVLTPVEREALYGRGMRNIVRIEAGLDYPGDQPGIRDRYLRAKDHLESWMALGILLPDPEPCFYVVRHTFPVPEAGKAGLQQSSPPGTSTSKAAAGKTEGTAARVGLLCCIPALQWGKSPILPHERTLREPIEDRTRLFGTARIQPSPLLILASTATLGSRLSGAMEGEPFLSGTFPGEAGEEELCVWRHPASSPTGKAFSTLSGSLYMADGHHRYETLAAYGQNTGRPVAALCLVVPADDPGLYILPTHRMVAPGSRPATPELLQELLAELFTVKMVPSRAALLSAVEDGSGCTLGIILPGSLCTATLCKTNTPAGAAGPTPDLPAATIADDLLLARWLRSEKRETGDTTWSISYTRSVDEAKAAVGSGTSSMAVIVPATRLEQMLGACDRGEIMPQKSTYFYPKVPAGIVMATL